VNGQTLEEENIEFVDLLSDWVDVDNHPILIYPLHRIKNVDTKLYGGQQFERMTSVFKAIVSQPQISTITKDELEDAAAVTQSQSASNNLSDYCWVACHLVKHHINKVFIPLIDQVVKRGSLIMKRLADIAFIAMENRSASDLKRVGLQQSVVGFDNLQSLKGYSYFQSTVRDIFYAHVDKIAQMCKDKCMDEIGCCQLLYWELTSGISNYSISDVKGGTNEKVLSTLATQMFEEMRDMIADNILLKSHNFFLVFMQRNLSGEILKDTSSFDEKLMEEMFELKMVKEQLKQQEEREKHNLQSFQEREVNLRDLSAQFSRFRLVQQIVAPIAVDI